MNAVMVSVDGVRLYVETGERNGPPVIFLHFGGAHGRVWRGVLAHLADSCWPVVMDARGHGFSEKPEGGYTIGQNARDLIGVMDALGIGRAHIVGSSMGAETAVRIAAEYPQRVESIVLEQAFQNGFGPHGTYEIPEAEVPGKKAERMAARAARPPLVADSAEELLALQLERWGRPGQTDSPLATALREGMAPRPDGRWEPLCPERAMAAYVSDWFDTRFEHDFARITCPVLFLPDEPSMADPKVRASMDWFCSLLPSPRVITIPGAEHAAVLLDQPAAVAGAVRQFHESIGRQVAG